MNKTKLPFLALVLCLLAVACSGGGGIKSGDAGSAPQDEKAAASVTPPALANPKLTARVGLIVATNSRSWARLLSSPADAGVTVLFVQPDGPAATSDIKAGDVITKVDGKAVTNAEVAVVKLRATPDATRTLDVVKVGGGHKTIAIKAKVPGQVDLLSIYKPLIDKQPENALLRFLRAQAGGPFDQSMVDIEKAVQLIPSFVEAISLRAELLWNKARDQTLGAATVDNFRSRAQNDWGLAIRLDPKNTRVLVSRSQAESFLQQGAAAKADAARAQTADKEFPGAYYALAVANYILGRTGGAAQPARTAIDLNPYDVRYYRLLAQVFMKLNRKDDAKKTVDAIVDLVDDTATKNDLLSIVEK